MNGGDPRGLDVSFRQCGLDIIKSRVKEYAKNRNDPTPLRSLDEVTRKLEAQVFVKATSRDDYLFKIEQQIAQLIMTYNNAPRLPSGNRLERNVFPRRSTVHSSSVQQNPNVVSNQYQQQQPSQMHSLPATQPRNMVVQQNHQFRQQNPPHFEHQNHLIEQQNRTFVQQNQQPVYARPVMNRPGTMRQYQDGRLQGGEMMPSAYVRSQNCTGAPALNLPSVNNSGTTNNSDDFQLLIALFRRARLQCLPEFHKWLKTIEQRFPQVHVDEHENYKAHIGAVRQMIKLLSTAENQLMQYDKQKIRQHLIGAINYYNKVAKNSNVFITNHAYQLPPLHQRLANPVPVNQHAVLPYHTSVQHLNKKNDPEIPSPESLQSVTGPERRNIPTDSDPLPNTCNNSSPLKPPETMGNNSPSTNNASGRKSNKKPSPSKLKKSSSAGNSLDSLLNLATLRSNKRSNSRNVSNNSTPSTPITPSSGNNAEAEIIKEAAINCRDQEKPIIVAAETTVLGSPVVSGFTSLQPTQQHSEKQPFDRLLDAVKVASKETLTSSVKDMKSAFTEMNELPDYAYLDHSQSPYDVYLTDFIESIDDEDQQPTTKRLKRDIETASRHVCYPDVQQSSKLQLNKNHVILRPYQMLLEEIKTANQNLSSTVVEVVDESNHQSNGAIVRCTYSHADEIADNLKSINISVEFLVPFEYPALPPKILDCKSADLGIGAEMGEMAKAMLDSQVRCVYMLRVNEMARMWDRCAQSVFLAYEKLFGSEISSKGYGWDPV